MWLIYLFWSTWFSFLTWYDFLVLLYRISLFCFMIFCSLQLVMCNFVSGKSEWLHKCSILCSILLHMMVFCCLTLFHYYVPCDFLVLLFVVLLIYVYLHIIRIVCYLPHNAEQCFFWKPLSHVNASMTSTWIFEASAWPGSRVPLSRVSRGLEWEPCKF